MKSLVDYIKEGKVDFKKVEETAKKAAEQLKKDKKEWAKYAEEEFGKIGDDDFEKFEDNILNDHSAAPAIWALVTATAEMLKMDPIDLFEEFGLDPFYIF